MMRPLSVRDFLFPRHSQPNPTPKPTPALQETSDSIHSQQMDRPDGDVVSKSPSEAGDGRRAAHPKRY